MKVIVAGGTGFIGSELINRLLGANHEVVLLTRNQGAVDLTDKKSLRVERWDGKSLGAWTDFIDGADAVINLSGENVAAKRWSEKQKQRLIDSRLEPTKAIVQAIANASKKPRVLINASAVGYYGNFGSGNVAEDEPKGDGFLGELCQQWEDEARQAKKYRVRVVLPRIGIVLHGSGGALRKMLLPFKLFIGGPIGSGKQWFPWIHRDDVIGIILFALMNDSISDAVNTVSPFPVPMVDFTLSLGRAMGRPSWMRVPSFILKIALGEMSEMLIGGRQIVPKKLLHNGFVFQYPDLDKALKSLMRKKD
jgi:uncharacterized protein (TIGR01777 family)